jgi:hypothetical protein
MLRIEVNTKGHNQMKWKTNADQKGEKIKKEIIPKIASK